MAVMRARSRQKKTKRERDGKNTFSRPAYLGCLPTFRKCQSKTIASTHKTHVRGCRVGGCTLCSTTRGSGVTPSHTGALRGTLRAERIDFWGEPKRPKFNRSVGRVTTVGLCEGVFSGVEERSQFFAPNAHTRTRMHVHHTHRRPVSFLV